VPADPGTAWNRPCGKAFGGDEALDLVFVSNIKFNMKPIQIMMDTDLLEALDATEEVQRDGRSAVLRRAVAEYLARIRRMEIRESYRRAYGDDGGLDVGFEGWTEQGAWPEE
jgi:hypothetical protein